MGFFIVRIMVIKMSKYAVEQLAEPQANGTDMPETHRVVRADGAIIAKANSQHNAQLIADELNGNQNPIVTFIKSPIVQEAAGFILQFALRKFIKR